MVRSGRIELDAPKTGATGADDSPERIGERLVTTIRSYGRVAVAFSGGVDSTVVASAAFRAIGPDAVAVTAVSPSLAASELESTRQIAQRIGIRHELIETAEFDNPDYVRNDGSRCYHCKSELYDRLIELQDRFKIDVICSGANLDDLGDYRPGLQAGAERGVRHPLQEAGLTKVMVRRIAQCWDLPNWNKPASPCLSSRIAIGLESTPERAMRVDRAEQILRDLGMSVLRVRYHQDEHARIEVPENELGRIVDPRVRRTIVERFKELGFKFVSLDLEGFRSGGLNVLLPPEMLIRQIE